MKLPLIGKRMINDKTNFSLTVDDEILLRLVEEKDLDEHYALLDANRAHIGAWETWVQTVTYQGQLDYIRFMLEQYAAGHGFTCGIWWHSRPDIDYTLAGNISYRSTPDNRTAEIGYWLGLRYTGRGIVTRATGALVEYALHVDNKNRVLIQTTADNLRSRAVAERLGFTLDGIIRQEMNIYGRLKDRAVYTMLADEWQSTE